MNSFHRKKNVAEIDRSLLREPDLSPKGWAAYNKGWRLFNNRKFWEAHEEWEEVWKGCPDESRIFFQGIIQLAAAYHLLLVKKRYGGMMTNFAKAEEKLRLFQSSFLGVNVEALLASIEASRNAALSLGPERLAEIDTNVIPTVYLYPTEPSRNTK